MRTTIDDKFAHHFSSREAPSGSSSPHRNWDSFIVALLVVACLLLVAVIVETKPWLLVCTSRTAF